MAKNKYVKEEVVIENVEITEEQRILIEEYGNTLIVPEILVNLDRIINADTKAILSTVSDKAIKETFTLLGKDKLDYIETEINQFASQKLLQSLFLISELDISNDEAKKKELITKIIPYLQK